MIRLTPAQVEVLTANLTPQILAAIDLQIDEALPPHEQLSENELSVLTKILGHSTNFVINTDVLSAQITDRNLSLRGRYEAAIKALNEKDLIMIDGSKITFIATKPPQLQRAVRPLPPTPEEIALTPELAVAAVESVEPTESIPASAPTSHTDLQAALVNLAARVGNAVDLVANIKTAGKKRKEKSASENTSAKKQAQDALEQIQAELIRISEQALVTATVVNVPAAASSAYNHDSSDTGAGSSPRHEAPSAPVNLSPEHLEPALPPTSKLFDTAIPRSDSTEFLINLSFFAKQSSDISSHTPTHDDVSRFFADNEIKLN